MRVFFMSDYNRPREVSLGICGPGQCAGEMSLDGLKRCASVITRAPLNVCVDASIVQEQLTTSPDLAIAFMQQAFVRARHATQVARPHFFQIRIRGVPCYSSGKMIQQQVRVLRMSPR